MKSRKQHIAKLPVETRRKAKYKDGSDSDENDNFEEQEEEESDAFKEESDIVEEDDDPENSEENESADDGNLYVSNKLHKTQCCLYLPINENKILGKWFAGIYKTKSKRLCIGQLMEQFPKDENVDVDVIEMRCLNPELA